MCFKSETNAGKPFIATCAAHVLMRNYKVESGNTCYNWCGSRDLTRILDGRMYCKDCFEDIYFNSPYQKDRAKARSAKRRRK